MLNLFTSKSKKRYLSLDIGKQSTKIMIFQPNKTVVDRLLIKPTPPDAFKSGVINEESNLSDFLIESLSEIEPNYESFDIITGISGKGVIAKKIDIPQMEEQMIPEFLEIEAEQELFYNPEEMELTYELLQGLNANKPEAQSLLVVTVSKNVIESYNNVINKTGISCEILDTNFAALFNVFEYNETLDENKTYMILDIGCQGTNLVIMIKKQIVFVRYLPLGGAFFNQEIKAKMGVDEEEAEELKISAGRGDSAPQELVSLISNELNETFIEELLSCYELYHSLFPGKAIDQAYITGGGSLTLGLISRLQEKLNCPVNPFDPFKVLSVSSELKEQQEDMRFFSSAVAGLSLRAFHDQN